MTNAAEDVTFYDLVENVYAKTKNLSNNLTGRLKFIVSIRPDMTSIYEKFLVHPAEFMSKADVNRMVGSAPKSLKVGKKSAESILRTEFDAITNARSVLIGKLYDQITKELSKPAPNKFDKEFDDSYQQWLANAPSETHAEIIFKKLDAMYEDYVQLSYSFDAVLDQVRKEERSIQANIKPFKTICEYMALTKETAETKDVIKSLVPLSTMHAELVEHLTNLRDILHEYNKKRFLWAELLVGMRLDLFGEREPLLKGVSMMKQFVILARKNAASSKQKGKK